MRMSRTVDGTHYPIKEPRPFSTRVSSHKFGGKAGLSYEICLSTNKQQIVWLRGPFPAGTLDVTIFRMHLLHAIRQRQQDRSDDAI